MALRAHYVVKILFHYKCSVVRAKNLHYEVKILFHYLLRSEDSTQMCQPPSPDCVHTPNFADWMYPEKHNGSFIDQVQSGDYSGRTGGGVDAEESADSCVKAPFAFL